jgi:DNA-binding Lrp family transcriptional regulator
VYSPVELKVMALLDKDNLMPIDEIAKALEIEPKMVKSIVKRLVADKVLKRNTTDIQGEEAEVTEPTNKANKILDKQPNEVLDFKVMYDYVERKNAPELVKGGKSRDFCKKLMGMNKLYSRADIESISDKVGYNAWEHKGGWYNNPETGETEDRCRHTWSQVIVTKKGKK